MSLSLIERFHTFLARVGISPKVADPLVLALLAVLANVIVTGELPDLSGAKLAVVGVLYALVGLTAPPATGVDQAEVDIKALDRVSKARR